MDLVLEDDGQLAGEEEDPLDAYMKSIEDEVVQQQDSTAIRVTATNTINPQIHQQQHSVLATATTSLLAADAAAAAAASGVLNQHRQPPSTAQLAVAHKVAASRFFDVSTWRRGIRAPRAHSRHCGTGVNRSDNVDDRSPDDEREAEVEDMCLGLLLAQPAEFLRRYGYILTPADLESLLPSQDPQVSIHVKRLQTLMSQQHQQPQPQPQQQQQQEQQRQQQHPIGTGSDPDDVDMSSAATAAETTQHVGATSPEEMLRPDGGRKRRSCPPDSARTKNRRYRRLQQLAEAGSWFGDEAMKERDPWLWFEHVGRWEGQERPAPRRAVEEVPGSTSVGTYLQESLAFLSQSQNGDWPSSAEEDVSAMRSSGPSLGISFLSGVCSSLGGDGGAGVAGMDMDTTTTHGERCRESGDARSVAFGEAVDASDLPEAAPSEAKSSQGVPGGMSDAGRCPREEADNDDDDGTGVVTEAVAAFSLQERTGGDGGSDRSSSSADNGNSLCRSGSSPRRVRFLIAGRGEIGEGERGRGKDDADAEYMEDEGEEEKEEGRGEGGEGGEEETMGDGREEVARILSERFLAGEEEGVNYADVDGDERLDDLDQLARDEQDRWFRSQADDASD